MRGLVVGIMAVIGVAMVSGCVTKWKYDEEVEKNEHLLGVKTEQDIERDGLHADVNALHRASTQQSLRVTAMEGVVTQATSELRTIQSRLTSMNQELTQQRSDVGKIAQQASEAVQLLRVLNEQQQVNAVTLSQVTTKLDAVKTATTARAARATAPVPAKGSNDATDGKPDSEKTAAERAMEQQMGLGPRPVAPLAAKSSPAPVSGPPAGYAIPAATPSSSPAPAVGSGSAPASAGEKVFPPSAAVSGSSSATGGSSGGVTAAESIKRVEDELSPLQRSSPEKPEAKPKQSWVAWAKEKIFGKSPVQTAAKRSPPVGSPSETR